MTAHIAWTGLVLVMAVVGRLGWHCVGPRAETSPSRVEPPRWMTRAEESFLVLASSFGLLSAGFFVLAHLGCFSTRVVAASLAIFVAGGAVACLRRRLLGEALAALPLDLALGAALAVSSLWFGMLLPPLDTTIAASDSSVYLAAAHQLARQGTIKHRDPLVAEMTPEEHRHFQLDYLFEKALSFESVRFVGHDTFPEPPGVVRLQSRVVEVRRLADGQVPRSISVGDGRQDVGILVEGFHGPETEVRPGQPARPFRWTGPVATMAFPPVAAIALTIDTSRPAPARPARVEVDVDGAPVDAGLTDAAGRHRLHIAFPGRDGSGKRIVSLRTNTFRMRELGLSEDARELGVRVMSAEIER